jgi:hypothetical protein
MIMSETKKVKQLFTVGRIFFLLIVIPLSLMALLIANGIFKVGETTRQRATAALDEKSQNGIKLRAINTAEDVAKFLGERRNDLMIATIIPTTDSTYKEFISKKKSSIWVKEGDKVQKVLVPLYTEMSLIDRTGKELIKITNGKIVPKSKLINVSNPANTTYKSEDYFDKASKLKKGKAYISYVTGWYVDRSAFEKGKRFMGVIRLATPLFDKKGFAGIIVLALDTRHLAEFTDHVVPTQSEYVVEADASTGNYAYMVDNRGFIISHPNDYHIIGLHSDGRPAMPLTQNTASALTEKGEEVLNLNLLGFMDRGMPEIAKDAAAGNSGIKTYKFKNHSKFVAYAPIKFYAKNYPKPGGFGWIGMGVDIDKFNTLARAYSENVEKEVKSWTTTIAMIIVISVILLFLITAILVRGISRSIEAEIPEGAESVNDYYEDEDEEEE